MKTKKYPVKKPIQLIDFPEFETLALFNSNGQGKNILFLGKKNETYSFGGMSTGTVLNHFTAKNNSWKVGYLSYDFKNHLEDLSSLNKDGLYFPLYHFWQPELVLEWSNTELLIHGIHLSDEVADRMANRVLQGQQPITDNNKSIHLKPRISKVDYLAIVDQIKEKIQQGDVYEMNFCHEFYSENEQIDTWNTYVAINKATLAPFSTYIRTGNHTIISASPELFIQKKGQRIISSPIKGTARRGNSEMEDVEIKTALLASKKERAENTMIVDLVRNDLSKIAEKGSVVVDEFLAVKSLKTVHQLVSTVSCRAKSNTAFYDIIQATFPMGSMTGAPKISAMQLAEEFETTARGVYSGTAGYIEPTGDFNFNVLIRTLLYNKKLSYLSLMVGGAITHYADAEQEYEETMLKAKAILEILKAE